MKNRIKHFIGGSSFGRTADRSKNFQLNEYAIDNERFKDLIESTDDWLWEVDKNGVYTYSSPQVFKILGYQPEEVYGKTPFDFMSDVEAPRVKKILDETMMVKGPITVLENINLHKNGKEVYLETSGRPFFNSKNEFMGYRGIDRDITAKRKLEEDSKFFKQALEHISEAAFFVDKEFKITYLNQGFCDLFGYMPAEIIGQPVSVLAVDGQDHHLQPIGIIDQVVEAGQWKGEVLRKRKDGSTINVSLSVKTAYNKKNELLGYTGSYFDLTDVIQSKLKLREALEGTIGAVSLTLEKRDPYTHGHQIRVADMCVEIARELGKSQYFIEGLRLGATIHDIGKIYVPSEILNRPGKLTEHEMGMIKTHSQVGYDIVAGVNFPWPIQDIIHQHHERLDGSGYPLGLKSDEICLEAKIVGVADVLEAMTSHRPYRAALPLDVGLEELSDHKGTRYDAEIVDICIDLCRKGYQVHEN